MGRAGTTTLITTTLRWNASRDPVSAHSTPGVGQDLFARRLSAIARRVEAIDANAAVIRRSSKQSVGFPNVRFIHADFMTWADDGPYDLISMIAVLHHLPFNDALTRAAGLLRSSGVLAVLGLDRAPSVLHAGARSILAYPLSAYRVTRGLLLSTCRWWYPG